MVIRPKVRLENVVRSRNMCALVVDASELTSVSSQQIG